MHDAERLRNLVIDEAAHERGLRRVDREGPGGLFGTSSMKPRTNAD